MTTTGSRGARRTVTTAGPAALGAAVGAAIVIPSPFLGEPRWPVWAALAIGLTGTAGAVFTYGRTRWQQLPDTERPPPRTFGTPLLLLLTGTLAIGLVPHAVGHNYGWRGSALVAVAVLGGIPAAATGLAVHRTARAPTWAESRGHGEQVAWLIDRRRLVKELLVVSGSLVALSTLALGAAAQIQGDLVDAGRLAPEQAVTPQVVVIFGSFGSLTVTWIFGPAAGALRRRGRQLCAELFDIAGACDAAEILDRAEQRQKLEAVLGADAGLFADLQSGLALLSPLIVGAAGLLLPK